MPMVTLIGEKLAKKGEVFIYLGPNNDCRNCKLKTVCFNLKIGRKYEITNIRDKKHSCNVHEGNASVVEVKELPIVTAVDKKYNEGSTVKINNNGCKHIGCENYVLCNTTIKKDTKYKITKTFEKIECPIGNELQKVEIIDDKN